MDPDPTPRPDATEPCAAARRWIAARVSGADAADDDVRAREHLLACRQCRELYRAQLADATRLRRAALRAAGTDLSSGRSTGAPRFAPRHRRLFVVVAVLAVVAAVVRMGGSLRPDPTLPVEWVAGELFVGGEPVGATFGPRTGLRGDLVQTGDDGRARLRLDEGVLLVDPATTLLVESAAARRVRLVGGRLTLSGEVLLWTPFGVVEAVDGRARVELDGDAWSLLAVAGAVRVVDAAGERDVPVGETLSGRLEVGRGSVASR